MLDKRNVDSIKPLAVAVDKLDSCFFAIVCVKIKCLLAGVAFNIYLLTARALPSLLLLLM